MKQHSPFPELQAIQKQYREIAAKHERNAGLISEAICSGLEWKDASTVNCKRNKPYVTRKVWHSDKENQTMRNKKGQFNCGVYFSSPVVAKFNGIEWEGISGPFSGEGAGFTLEVWV